MKQSLSFHSRVAKKPRHLVCHNVGPADVFQFPLVATPTSNAKQQCTIRTHSPSPGWAVLAHHPVTFPLFSPWYEKRMLSNYGGSWGGGFSGTFLSIPSECFTDFPKQIFVPHMLGMMACFCWNKSLGMKTQPLVLSTHPGHRQASVWD